MRPGPMKYTRPHPRAAIKFGSKADTLEQLQGSSLSCSIPAFTSIRHARWTAARDEVVGEVAARYAAHRVAVRSSAQCEDGLGLSHAGAFSSFLHVQGRSASDLARAIDDVFASYPDTSADNQVIVQVMVGDIALSGVILTRCVDDGSPYYVLNYDDESGRSDSITGGTGVHKTVMVYRGFQPHHVDSPRVRQMLALAQELEERCGLVPLDIEFAMDGQGAMHLLQVRRISTVGGWHPDIEHRVSRIIPHVEEFVEQLSARKKGLHGDYTILGNMPDWNPAEIIGVIPSPLAASLYRRLITAHAWSLARMEMGYRRMPRTELMVLIGGRPFIDVRASFNSFLPDGLSETAGGKLVNAWLDRLAANPSLHDKVEFDVALTALDFTFDDVLAERYGDILDAGERRHFKDALGALTDAAMDPSPAGSLSSALARIDGLAARQGADTLAMDTDSPVALAAFIAGLLDECTREGTLPFSIIARHAFIAEGLLRSAVRRGALAGERVAAFKSSFRTIMGELAADTLAVCEGRLEEARFHARYGHLRPGTYDILSPCYRDRSDLFTHCHVPETARHAEPFVLTAAEQRGLEALLKDANLRSVDAAGLLAYAQRAIQGREYAKFVFTRNLSAALEAIAAWGEFRSLGREDLAHLRIEDVLDTGYASTRSEMTSALMEKVDQARVEQSFAKILKLSHLIRGVQDIHVVPSHRSQPNFITQQRVERFCEFLQASTLDFGTLENKIVCIENADPGFDWIFSKGIAGLVTKFGGANSHMAIRCAELQLPAAIGCGEDLFERLRRSRKLELNCSAKTLRSVDAYA